MSDPNLSNRGTGRPGLVVGVALVLFGAFFLVVQLFGAVFRFDVSYLTWPFFIIVPGVVVLLLALSVPNEGAVGFAMFGGMVTMTGLLLLYQNATNHWESWAYAWALVAPTGAGLGMLATGVVRGRKDWLKSGSSLVTIGLILFLVGAIFFELVIGISGYRSSFSGVILPLLLILVGVILLLRAIIFRRA